MIFVKAEDLKVGMRLAKPIYNKKGIMLYERNTKLTQQGIQSVKNFNFIGLYILEPAEPLPPMSDIDIEFERFQTMSVFNLKENLQLLISKKEPKGIQKLINSIIKNYGNLYTKINFMQNIRSKSDYLYKHSLNVAILSAIISNVLGIHGTEQEEIVYASLIYDVGKINLEDDLVSKENPDEAEFEKIKKAINEGHGVLEYSYKMPMGVKRLVGQVQRKIYYGANEENDDVKMFVGTKIIEVADAYDKMTAMKLDENPASEIKAIKYLKSEESHFDQEIVKALIYGINIAAPGTCIEFVNGEKGLVVRTNLEDVLKPMILDFRYNHLHELDKLDENDGYQIKDVMKTMDNRIIINQDLLEIYKDILKDTIKGR